MKKFVPFLLLASLGCTAIHRHPVIFKVVVVSAAGATGATIAHYQNRGCPGTYDGKPYDGTPPCPK